MVYLLYVAAVLATAVSARAFLRVAGGAAARDEEPEGDPARNPNAAEGVRSVIGYKRAWLRYNWLEPFTGVGGHKNYGVEGVRKDSLEGFYAFIDVESALAHHQEGNVYLEVVQAGSVEFFELGQVSDRQRVLQVLIDACQVKGCEEQATRWLPGKEEDDYRLKFYCSTHVPGGRTLGELKMKLESETHFPLVVAPLRSVGDLGSYVPTARN